MTIPRNAGDKLKYR